MTDTDTDTQTYYSIVSIFNGSEIYQGDSLSMAAERLKPGMVYGTGTTQEKATAAARKQRKAALKGTNYAM